MTIAYRSRSPLGRAALTSAALWLAGCGAAMPEGASHPSTAADGAPAEPDGSADDYASRIEQLVAELDATLPTDAVAEEQAAPPMAMDAPSMEMDEEMGGVEYEPLEGGESGAPSPEGRGRALTRCETAADLTGRICDLAGRICAIAADHPDDAPLQDKCDIARASCERARHDRSASCDGR